MYGKGVKDLQDLNMYTGVPWLTLGMQNDPKSHYVVN